ncbi:unnamed protein product [Clavelina lepadiformis]|uniref:Uncharacterized protein n=1 Tax=Clavelina lepadiformis TaxID=159417 RepID=A0ABP0GGY0_CLALP
MESIRWLVLFLIIIASQSSAEIFTTEPKDQLVPLESTADVSFTCATNAPDSTFSWTKNMDVIATSSTSRFQQYGGTLIISKPEASDAGVYQCVLSNEDGKVISNGGNLSFAYVNDFPPADKDQINTITGQGVAIPCAGADYAPSNEESDILTGRTVDFYWEAKNKWEAIKPPGNKTHYVSQKTGTLYLASPTQIDQDVLSCGVRANGWDLNGVPVDKKSGGSTLTVSESTQELPPVFLVQPGKNLAVLGGNALLECFASGLPVPDITWSRKSGLPANHKITEAGQLLLNEITEDMEGDYICTASNNLGSKTSTGSLTLGFAPEWTQEIESSEADLSSMLTMFCSATGVPPPSLKWYKDGIQITSSNRFTITSDENGSTMQIEDVKQADGGMYQCVATNKHGSTFSSAKLTVLAYGPEFAPGGDVPDVTKGAVGNDVTITCEVKAAPPANFTWVKDSVDVIVEGTKYSILETGSLQIHDISLLDEGDYTCEASNTLGEISDTGYLKIFDSVEITQGPVNKTIDAGDGDELVCKATHDARLSLSWKWTKDGESLEDSETHHYDISGRSLLIASATSDQTGSYKCCAVTEVGEDCGSAYVMVIAPPDPPQNVAVTSSSAHSQMLTWMEPSNNGAEITQYIVEGKDMYDDLWSVMSTIPDVVIKPGCDVIDLRPFNGYQYRISARNENGQGMPSEPSKVATTLKGAPSEAPSGLRGGVSTPGNLVVKWESLHRKYFGDVDVDYIVAIRKLKAVTLPIDLENPDNEVSDAPAWVEKVVSGGSSHSTAFQVNETEIYQPYETKILAENDAGEGPDSETAIVHTAEAAPAMAPTGLRTSKVEACHANITWNGVPDENGRTRGYKVKICNMKKCDAGSDWRNLTTIGGSPYIYINNLDANNLYGVKTAGFNTAGMGPWSTVYNFNTQKQPPSNAPTNVKLQLVGRTITSSWDAVEQEIPEGPIKGYVAEYWPRFATNKNAANEDTKTTSIKFDLPEDGEYEVWIRAYNAGGMGKPTHTFSVSTLKSTSGKQQGGGGSASALKTSFLHVISIASLWSVVNVLL